MSVDLDRRYLQMVDQVADLSKDPSTKIGAIITYKSGLIISAGFNGFPSGVSEDVPSRWERPEKYYWVEHAERNAIQRAALDDYILIGTTLYTTGIPCADCAKAVIGHRIKHVVVWKSGSGLETAVNRPAGAMDWTFSIQIGRQMLEEAGVKIREVER